METKTYGYDILIVDDDDFNLKVAADILKKEFTVRTAQSGERALQLMGVESPRLVLLDLHMPGMDGRDTMKKIQENEQWKKIPIIFLTADTKPKTEQECLVLGASDFITKPFVPMVMLSRIRRILELSDLQNDLESRLEEKTKLVEKVSLNSIMVIANAIDAKDAYTSGHSVRVAKCASAIARKMRWNEEEVQNLHYIALLHDIGKIGVPDAILNKPARLNNDEFDIIKKHPVIGNDILKDIHVIKNVAEGALYHHERYDGKGYPFGISGEDIPLCARIIGIADAYDAMTSNRIYRRKLSTAKVMEEFERGRGSQFDPQLTDLFLDMLEDHFDVSKESSIFWSNNLPSESSALLNKVLAEYRVDLQDQETEDMLTGLYNRKYADTLIGQLLDEGHFGTLLMLDIDNFKLINDTMGHIAGDKTLQTFAEILRANTGEEDVLCRLGGDEFMVFFTDETDREQVARKTKKILDVFTESLERLHCGKIVSVSAGIAFYPGDGKTLEALYGNADKALYFVKRNGKKTYCFYSDDKYREDSRKTGMDLAHIRRMIEGRMDADKGIYRVGYDDFQKMYSYIFRGVKQTLLFTLGIDNRHGQKMQTEDAMQSLELSVASSLRMVDIGTRYSSIQYMVILLDTDLENGRKVADRVIKQFYQIYGGKNVTVSYDIQTMQPQPEEEYVT